MKGIFNTRKAVALALSLFLLIQTVVIATTVISAGATTTVSAAQAGDTLSADFTTLSTVLQQGFKHYYTEQTTPALTGSQPMVTTTAIGLRWACGVDAAKGNRIFMSNYSPTNNWVETWYAHSNLVYTKKTFKNFELDVDYYFSEHAQNAKRLLYIGFGKTEEDKSIFNTSGAGGIAIALRYDGNVALVNNGTIGSFTTTQSMSKNTWASLKLVVEGTTAQVYRNTALIATYTLPGSYNGGYVFFGGNRATASGFAGLKVVEKAAPTLYTADFTKDFKDTTKWKTYWAKNVLVDSSLTAPSFDRCFTGVSTTNAFVNRPKQNADNTGTLLTSAEFETYSSTFNVAQLTYIAKKYKNFELNAEYEFSTHSNNNARILIGFGREDATKYATHADGGAVLEFDSNANVVYRDAKGTRAASVSAPSSAAKTTRVAVNLVVNEYKATVSVNEKVLGTFTLSEDYEGYISIGATQANASKFYSLSILATEDNESGETRPTPVDPNLYTADFTSDFRDTAKWKTYWAKNVLVDSSLTAPAFDRCFTGVSTTNAFVNRPKQNADNTGTLLTSAEFETYSSTFNVAQLTYIAKKYKNFELNAEYEFSTHSNNNARILIGFGREDATKYATHADGGAVLEFDSAANVTYRDASGAVAATTAAPASAAKATRVSVKVVVDAWIAKVYVNETLLGSFIVPENYEGYISIGATQANASKFYSLSVLATEDNESGETRPTPVDPNLYTADFTKDFRDIAQWKTYWAKNVLVDSSLTAPAFDRCFTGVSTTNAFVNRPKQNADNTGALLTSTEFETYSSTFNVAQLTYIAKKYKNFELNAEYEFSTHSNNNARILIGFGRADATKYATHADGGAVLEFDSNANVVYRDASGTVAAETAAPASAAKTSVVSVKVVVDAWIAKVYVNETLLGSFIVPENYEGYVSIGATQANASKFYSLSILATEDNESGETRPTPVDPNTLPYSADFANGFPEGWKSYWMRDTIEGSELTEKPFGISWYHVTGENGHLRRTDSGSFLENDAEKQIVSSTFNVAQLALASRKFKNFEMEFEYKYVGATGARIFLGLGRKDLGKFANHEDGGAVISLASDGNLSVIVAGGTPYALTTNAPESAAHGNMVKVKVKVDAWLFTVWVNDVEMGTYLLPEDYEGYVSVGATKAQPSELYSIKITPLADNESGETRPDESLYSPDMQDYSTEFKNGQPDGWVNYWLEDSTLEGDTGNKFVSGTAYGYHWVNGGGEEGYMSRTDSGFVTRLGLSVNPDIENSTYNIANLTYAERKFNNFVMNLTYVYNSNGNGRIMLGFGKKDIERYATHKDGGTILSFANSGNLSAIIAGAEETELSVTAPASAARFNEVNVTLTVDNWIATVNVNGVDVAAYLLPEDYKGYISVGATRAKTSYFKSITVTPLADNGKDDIRPTEAPSFDTDWSEIIGKEPDNGIPPTVSGLPFLDAKLEGSEEDYIIRLYENGIPAKFYLDEKVLALPWENITISELLGSMWIAENTEIEFTMPDGEVLEDPNTILISGLLMKVYEDGKLSGTYKIVVGEYKADNKQENITDLDAEKDDTVTVIKPSDKPAETGDNSILALAIIVLTLSLLGAAYVVFGRKATSKRRG